MDEEFDIDLERLQYSVERQPEAPVSNKLFGHRKRELFLRGPVPMPWLLAAFRLGGKALHVAIVLWHRAGVEHTATVKLRYSLLRDGGVSRYSARRGLAALEGAGLISVVRKQGRAPVVTLIQTPEAPDGVS